MKSFRVKKLIKKILDKLGIGIFFRETKRNNFLFDLGIPKNEWEYKGHQIYLKEIDLFVESKEQIKNLSYYYAKKIYNHSNGRFSVTPSQDLLVEIDGITFTINDPEELFIITEVFLEQQYNFNTKDKIVVVDIGQNVAVSSLFFASKENVKKVYGFELFPETYKLGQINVGNNKHLANKIISKSYGLGNTNKVIPLKYSSKCKGRMGLNGLPLGIHDGQIVEVQIKDVYEELIQISELEKGVPIVCKMDCEGAEYELLDRLFNHRAIGLINTYLIEWHFRNPDYLVDLFLENSFQVFKFSFPEYNSGMLYALKSK